jgi:hypothetical protein
VDDSLRRIASWVGILGCCEDLTFPDRREMLYPVEPGEGSRFRRHHMKKYLLAAVLIGALAGPALADEVFVMLDMTTKKCVTMKTDPKDQKKFKMLGKYPTLGEAEAAMHTMTECK